MNEVVINGKTYIPKEADVSLRIVILHRGFVYVGNFSQDGPHCVLHNAKNIRRWGTSAGLGQLAENGPFPETKLDPAGTVRFHELGVIATLDCNEDEWHV